MKESQTGGRRKRKQQKRLCFSECVQQGKKFLAFSKGRIHQQMPLLFCQGKRSTLRTVLPSLLGRHLLAQPWGRRKYHLSSTEASLMVLLLARLFGFSLLLFQPCSHCPIMPAPQGVCSRLQRDCFTGGLHVLCLFHRSCSGACLRDRRGLPSLTSLVMLILLALLFCCA